MSPASEIGQFADFATMVPATVQLDGNPIGYPGDGTSMKATCDQIAAFGPNGLVRGVSTTIEAGFSLAFLGTAGELITFQYWDGVKEYDSEVQYTMEANGAIGSFQGCGLN